MKKSLFNFFSNTKVIVSWDIQEQSLLWQQLYKWNSIKRFVFPVNFSYLDSIQWLLLVLIIMNSRHCSLIFQDGFVIRRANWGSPPLLLLLPMPRKAASDKLISSHFWGKSPANRGRVKEQLSVGATIESNSCFHFTRRRDVVAEN